MTKKILMTNIRYFQQDHFYDEVPERSRVVQTPDLSSYRYQAPAPPDFKGVSKADFPSLRKANGCCANDEENMQNSSRALIYVYEGEITLRVGREAITFYLDQTSRYTANYNHMTANRIDIIDMACEEYSQEVLGFSNVISSGNPTPYYDPIISTSSPTLTPFGDSDFLLFEEADSFLAIEDDPTSPEVDPTYYDFDGDILLLEAILNSHPSPPPPNQGNYFPEIQKDLKIYEVNNEKSSVNEPPEVELKDLPPYLEYAFLEGNDKLPIIIAKDLKNEEKASLIQVLKSHKRAIAWKLSNIKGIDPEFCTPTPPLNKNLRKRTTNRRFSIKGGPWVSPMHYVPKKGGINVVKNDENDLIPTRLVTGWRVCIDYRKLNEATRKGHFPLAFIDQMLERLEGNQYYCFLDGFSGYFQIPIDSKDQEKTTFTCLYGTFAYRRMPFGLCNAPGTFQRCMMAIFHDMIEKTMEVFMDDFIGPSGILYVFMPDPIWTKCKTVVKHQFGPKLGEKPFMCKRRHVLGHKISNRELRSTELNLTLSPSSLAQLLATCNLGQSRAKKKQKQYSNQFTMPDKTMTKLKHTTLRPEKELLAVVIRCLSIRDKKGAEIWPAESSFQLENPPQDNTRQGPITETFPPSKTLDRVALV
ncbi:reverse transcriptase domain-containing protein [Tanacetum coccineum]